MKETEEIEKDIVSPSVFMRTLIQQDLEQDIIKYARHYFEERLKILMPTEEEMKDQYPFKPNPDNTRFIQCYNDIQAGKLAGAIDLRNKLLKGE